MTTYTGRRCILRVCILARKNSLAPRRQAGFASLPIHRPGITNFVSNHTASKLPKAELFDAFRVTLNKWSRGTVAGRNLWDGGT